MRPKKSCGNTTSTTSSPAILPVFIPHLGCPHACIFCNQHHIASQPAPPSPARVAHMLEDYLSACRLPGRPVEVAFYGGSFTALPLAMQRAYLQAVAPLRERGRVTALRVSTRPDAVSRQGLELLRGYGVTTVELGLQSMDDGVLARAGRGCTASRAWEAARLVRETGLRLGVQLMAGLPGDSRETCRRSARAAVAMGAALARLYPLLVVRDTPLARLWEHGRYQPLSLQQAVEVTADMFEILEAGGARVIRCGLQATPGLEGRSLLAGPFHPAFGEMVHAEVFMRQARWALQACQWQGPLQLRVPPRELSRAVGLKGANRAALVALLGQPVEVVGDPGLRAGSLALAVPGEAGPRVQVSREDYYRAAAVAADGGNG